MTARREEALEFGRSVEKPADPIDYLIKVLKRDAVPKVVVAGPPGAQARSVCELVAAKSNLVHVVASDMWRELSNLGLEAGLQAKALVEQNLEVPDELLLTRLKEKLNSGDCISRGWVLEGFPSTPPQARAMCTAGLLPTRFLHIALGDGEAPAFAETTDRRLATLLSPNRRPDRPNFAAL